MKPQHTIVRHADEISSFKNPCGNLKVLTSLGDFSEGNISEVEMLRPSHPHYHNIITEFYYVLSGSGLIIVSNESMAARPGTTVIIPPKNAHYVIPYGVMKILAFAVPAWYEKDEFLLEPREDKTALRVGYSPYVEKRLLLEELYRRKGIPQKGNHRAGEKKPREVRGVANWDQLVMEELRKLLTLPRMHA